jgi:hypothetical protein
VVDFLNALPIWRVHPASPEVGTRAAKIDLLDVTNSTFTCNGSGCDSITLLRSEFKGQPMPEITELLQAWSNGNDAALETLIAQVDPELRQIAHKYMLNERPEHLLQTTPWSMKHC